MPDISKMPPLPGMHFGKIEEPEETAELPDAEGMDDDDDELLPESDPALVEMLGFDPLELEEDE